MKLENNDNNNNNKLIFDKNLNSLYYFLKRNRKAIQIITKLIENFVISLLKNINIFNI